MALTVKYITKRFIMEYDPYIEGIYTKHEDVDGQEFIVNVMDTYEKDDFSNSQRYLRWRTAFIVVLLDSITDRSSFESSSARTCRKSLKHLRISNKDCR
ncbi:ras-like protein family member 12, partial [Ruditapes philippinarum]|uniref:ras-like protein family member 12 n=1 Tax=Ruditapes philippinarum TaxID=129788 RepID=UPI00295A6885